MVTNAVVIKVDEARLLDCLKEAGEQIGNGEVVLDFATLGRVEPRALKALEDLSAVAQEKTTKVVIRGVNVDVYKVLKLAKLAPSFVFEN